jgi:hypothetical protein
MRDSAVMISSTMPSTKYSCSGSPLILAKGRTRSTACRGAAVLGPAGPRPSHCRVASNPAQRFLR